MSQLAICAIFKNEAPYLLEWIAYHRVVGFDHFYLYDNDSTDGGSALIRASHLGAHVTLTQWPPRPGQLSAYRHFIDHHAHSCDWAAFIDIDEFLLPLTERSVRPMLDRMPHASAVLVHWRVFGPSGWMERPEGLVIDNYTMRGEDGFSANRHVKSIVRCVDLLDVTKNPHEFRLRGQPCDTMGRPVPNIGIQATACHEALVINHYQTRSRQDWLEKIHRGSAMIEQDEPKYPPALLDHYAEISTVADHQIQSFADAVRAALTSPDPAPDPALLSPDEAIGWAPQGDAAWNHPDGLALVYRDTGRFGRPWLGALRRSAAGRIDPTFLIDVEGHIRVFATDRAAIAACEAALALLSSAEPNR